ncbi:proclotting enzyme isoform X2 [Hyalella azteca]|uniref:Proclotting enzyme isoform X2 n=1 Tax=Hyalella azteca TaxID=294128 RepID=A0A8B7P195_HYAAZ|nr:proclotting enzyme isoform X2 [Hyalella azteca]
MPLPATWWMLTVSAVALMYVAPASLSGNDDGEVMLNTSKAGGARAQFNRTCKCGKKFTRIVGGTETYRHEYPWQAALVQTATGEQFCGGSLITNQHILTAAHCLQGFGAEDVVVHLRDHNLTNPSETNLVERNVTTIYTHHLYDPVTNNNDIAIIHLNKTVRISARLLPVCLPSSALPQYGNKEAVVTGWGATSSGGPSSSTLLEVTVPVLTQKHCQQRTGYQPSEITSRMLCAGAAGLDSCQGDSGGPLVHLDKGQRYDQIGIVSFGRSCGLENFPGVYTRVNKFLRWIEKRTLDGVYCAGFSFPTEIPSLKFRL